MFAQQRFRPGHLQRELKIIGFITILAFIGFSVPSLVGLQVPLGHSRAYLSIPEVILSNHDRAVSLQQLSADHISTKLDSFAKSSGLLDDATNSTLGVS